jgi:hypothetical protein
MADTHSERLHRHDALRVQTEPILRHCALDDDDSSYRPSGCTEPLLSYSATATSRAHSGRLPTPSKALSMALELLCYQPTETRPRGGGHASLSSSTSLAALPRRPTPWRLRHQRVLARGKSLMELLLHLRVHLVCKAVTWDVLTVLLRQRGLLRAPPRRCPAKAARRSSGRLRTLACPSSTDVNARTAPSRTSPRLATTSASGTPLRTTRSASPSSKTCATSRWQHQPS